MNRKLGLLTASAMALLMAACGGGGGGTDASLEGAYDVVADGAPSGNAIVLEDGTLWGIGGTVSAGTLFVESMIQGPLTSSGSSVTSNSLRAYDFESGLAYTASFSGTAASSGVISGTNTVSGVSPVTVSLTPTATADFNFNTAATQAAIAGTWSGFFSSGDTGSVTVSSSGAIDSLTDAGCRIGGTVVPRPSGKNVYNVTITFGPAPCLLPNGSGRGIAVIAGWELTVAAVTADRAYGAAFFGTRP